MTKTLEDFTQEQITQDKEELVIILSELIDKKI